MAKECKHVSQISTRFRGDTHCDFHRAPISVRGDVLAPPIQKAVTRDIDVLAVGDSEYHILAIHSIVAQALRVRKCDKDGTGFPVFDGKVVGEGMKTCTNLSGGRTIVRHDGSYIYGCHVLVVT